MILNYVVYFVKIIYWFEFTKVLYMSFDRFLLGVESRDLFQADKSIITVSSFLILQNFNSWMIKFRVVQKSHLALGNLAKLVFRSILSFNNWSFAKLLIVLSVSLVLREFRPKSWPNGILKLSIMSSSYFCQSKNIKKNSFKLQIILNTNTYYLLLWKTILCAEMSRKWDS